MSLLNSLFNLKHSLFKERGFLLTSFLARLFLVFSQVYRKHRVADMSGGPGAYLEPEAAAAQIASGKKVDYESDDGFGDALVTRPEKSNRVADNIKKEGGAQSAVAATATKQEPGTGGGSSVAVSAATKQESEASTPAKQEAQSTENGSNRAAPGVAGSAAEEGIDVQSTSGGLDSGSIVVGGPSVKEDEGHDEEDINVDDDVDVDVDVDPSDAQSLQREQAQRAQVERRMAAGLNMNVQGGQEITVGAYGGNHGSDGPGTQFGYGENVGAGYQGYGAGGHSDGGQPTVGGGRVGGGVRGPGRPRGRGRGSFEGGERDASVAESSASEDDELDWDDSADEDMDAEAAEAMEQARIDMARAAARDLRESRATR